MMRSPCSIMGIRILDILAAIIINFIQYANSSEHILSCKVNSLGTCPGEHQYCDEQTQKCACDAGFTLQGDSCEPQAPAAVTHHTTAAIVTILTLALVICGLVLVVRKYNLIEYIRQKVILRRRNDIMYEDVMIGQDDPPLTP